MRTNYLEGRAGANNNAVMIDKDKNLPRTMRFELNYKYLISRLSLATVFVNYHWGMTTLTAKQRPMSTGFVRSTPASLKAGLSNLGSVCPIIVRHEFPYQSETMERLLSGSTIQTKA